MKPMKNPSSKSKSKPTAPPADLLVCFPARARLTLLPKPISSPAGAPAEPHRGHHKKPAQASPLLWAKEMSSEPTSPKVTCAGQIKIRPNAHRSKNWQSVMEEIERIHNKKKIPSWGNRNQNRNQNQNQNQNPLGFKREIVNFLSCLRGFRFDFRCFRGFPQSELTTDEEDESEPEPESESEEEPIEASRKTMFSEWFMVLQEEETKPRNDVVSSLDLQPCSAPPPNALLLMRCRSAPSIGWIERKPKQEQEQEQEEEEEEEKEKQSKMSLKLLMEEDKERLVVMDYDSDFYRLSSDIAKETWVVSGTSKSNEDPLMRTRSWKR